MKVRKLLPSPATFKYTLFHDIVFQQESLHQVSVDVMFSKPQAFATKMWDFICAWPPRCKVVCDLSLLLFKKMSWQGNNGGYLSHSPAHLWTQGYRTSHVYIHFNICMQRSVCGSNLSIQKLLKDTELTILSLPMLIYLPCNHMYMHKLLFIYLFLFIPIDASQFLLSSWHYSHYIRLYKLFCIIVCLF